MSIDSTGTEQNRKKSKAPKPPSTNTGLGDNNEITNVNNTKSQLINKQQQKEQSTENKDIENGNLILKERQVQTAKTVNKVEPEMQIEIPNTNREAMLEDDERFSPEKERALQTLDDVIQEVENSLGK